MTKEEIQAIVKEYIKDNLTIKTDVERDYGNEYAVVSIFIDGECISSDTFSFPSTNNY